MNWLDIILIVIIAVPTIIGLKMGLIKAVFSLVGVVVGIILAGNLYASLATQLTFISQESIAKIVAFAIIFIMVMIIAGILSGILTKIVSLVLLGWVNHLGGAAFGFLLGTVSCAALLAIWAKSLGIGDTIATSGVAVILLDRFPMVLALLPEEFDTIRSFF